MREPKLDLPVVYLTTHTLPEGWERAVIAAWSRGGRSPRSMIGRGIPRAAT